MSALQAAQTAAAGCGKAACTSRYGCSPAVATRRSSVGRSLQKPAAAGRRAQLCRGRRLHAAQASSSSVTLIGPDGTSFDLEAGTLSVGSAGDADLRVTGSNALVGDEDNLFSDTHTWLNGSQLRQGVAYLVAPGATLAFGDEQQQYTVDFEEAGSASPAMEMLMKGMASGGSEEVRKQLEDS